MQGLTKRQREIVDFIETYITTHRYSPSYRDIQQHFGFSSLGSVYNHVQSLKKKGFLPENTQPSRSITLVAEKGAEVEIPLIGKVRGGMPIETYSQVSMIKLPSYMVPSTDSTYLLRVEGSAFAEEWIKAGDLLLVLSKRDFEDHEMVLAQVGNQTTLIKRCHHDSSYIRLESENPEVQPMMLREDHVQILGVILSLIRYY